MSNPGKWEVYTQWVMTKRYRVGRIIDTSQPLHSGNIEYATSFFVEEAKAEEVCELKNLEEMA